MSLFEAAATESGPEANAPGDPQEAAVVARARAGDADAWESLVRRHQEPVFRLAYLILGDAAEAEDIAQEAFLRATLALGRFDEARPLRPWLLSIAANLARNRRRGLGRAWAAMQRAFLSEPRRHHPPPDRTPASDARRLRQAVERLRPDARDVVYLRYFLGLSEAETAAALNIPPGTAKSRHSRALAQLRAVIDADFPDLREALGSD
jgi:RNA polymerase sigma-70 factor (ECF subfamily)